MKKTFCLVDCDNFYVSCERLFNPGLEGKPVVVLSNNDGCIVSRSNEAKLLGIPMGAPFFHWKEFFKQQGVVVLSSNYALYGDISGRLMQLLEESAPCVEIYSIDEAWIDLSAHPSPESFARELREKIRRWTGIPVTLGIAPTKTLAKVASKIAKKTTALKGMNLLFGKEEIDQALRTLEVDELWGIGARLAAKLKERGISKAIDLKNADPFKIRRLFSVMLERTVWELRTISCFGLEENVSPPKQILSSQTFGQTLFSLDELRAATAHFVKEAARKLRQFGLAAHQMSVFLRHGPFPGYIESASSRFMEPIGDVIGLLEKADSLLQALYKPQRAYTKSGVILFDLLPQSCHQASFWPPEEEKERKYATLSHLLEELPKQKGKPTLRVGTELLGENWRLRFQRKTPSYTSRWEDIPAVKA